MIEAIAAFSSSTAAPPKQTDASSTDATQVSLQQPTSAEAADFARALGGVPTPEIAAAVPAGDTLSARLAAQADQLSSHLQAFGPGAARAGAPAETAAAGHPLADARLQMGEAVAQIEQAYMFAIETTMASRGSTETTKIFNTLLKGQ